MWAKNVSGRATESGSTAARAWANVSGRARAGGVWAKNVSGRATESGSRCGTDAARMTLVLGLSAAASTFGGIALCLGNADSGADTPVLNPKYDLAAGRTDDEFIQLATEMRNKLRPPIQSNFRVFSILCFENSAGEECFVTGTNSEQSFIGGSICAERSAAVQLPFCNFKRMTKIYVTSDMDDYITPVGVQKRCKCKRRGCKRCGPHTL